MKSKRYGSNAGTRLKSIGKVAIAIFALSAAGVATPFQWQQEAVANARAVSEAPPMSGGTTREAASSLIRKKSIHYPVSKSPSYCPAGPRDARGGSGRSLCQMFWPKEYLLGKIRKIALIEWVRDALDKGASSLSPVIDFVAGHCLAFLK